MSEQTAIDKLHNDKPITKIVISPKDEYLVTYSKEDNSIVGWNVEGQPEPENHTYSKIDDRFKVKQICISDDKKLAYIYSDVNDKKLLSK